MWEKDDRFIARSHHGRNGIMFGLVIPIEALLAFSGARTLSNNTAEMTAMIGALSFLDSMARLPVMRIRVLFFLTPSMLRVFVCIGTFQARTDVQLAFAYQRSMICAQHRLRLTMQHVYGHPGIWVMNVPIMPLHLVHLASFPVPTLPLAGFVIIFTHLPVVVVVTASAIFF